MPEKSFPIVVPVKWRTYITQNYSFLSQISCVSLPSKSIQKCIWALGPIMNIDLLKQPIQITVQYTTGVFW